MKHIQVNEKLDRTDRAIVAALKPLRGVVVTGALVTQGGAVRDADAIVFAPTGVLVVEGKGSSGHTGEVDFSLNRPWSIGGDPDAFKNNPARQVRKVAQILKTEVWDGERVWANTAVCVAGEGITVPGAPAAMSEDSWVCTPATLPALIGRLTELVSGPTVLQLLRALDLEPADLPTAEQLRDMGFPDVVPDKPRPTTAAEQRAERAHQRTLESKARHEAATGDLIYARQTRAVYQAYRKGDTAEARRYDSLVDPTLNHLPPMPSGYPPSGTSNRMGRAHAAARRQIFVAYDALSELPGEEQEQLVNRLEEVFAHELGLYEHGQWLDLEPDDAADARRWQREKAEQEAIERARQARDEELASQAEAEARKADRPATQLPLTAALAAAAVVVHLLSGRNPLGAALAALLPAAITAYWLTELGRSNRTRRRHGRRPHPAGVVSTLMLAPFAIGAVASGLDAFAQHGWFNSFVVAVLALPAVGIPAGLIALLITKLNDATERRRLQTAPAAASLGR